MTDFYYYLVLFNAASSIAAAAAVYWKNRHRATGPLFGLALLVFGLWLGCFAQYFRPLPPVVALRWAQLTLAASILSHPLIFHAMCVLVEGGKRYRFWMILFYALALGFIALTWSGQLIVGVQPIPVMEHYAQYNRFLYPWLGGYYLFTIVFGLGIVVYSAAHATGYKRTHLIYYCVAWLIIGLTTNALILPFEYKVYMPPLAFFVLPLNLLFLTYVLSKARLVEFNVALARFLLYSVALLVVAALTFLFVGGLTLVAPGFMGQGQVLFTVCLVMTIALVLVITLPRFFPVAERIVQERISGGRLVYQDMLANLVKELSRASSIDQMLETVATTIHSNMQVTRVLIFLQDPLTDEFRLQSQSGLNPEALSDGMTLTARSPSVRWLREHKDALVQDEVARTQPPSVWGELAKEFNHFGVTLYVPMLLDERLVGVIAFGEKQNREMFYASDLRLLGTLATEVALGVRYRRLEEQAVHQNKLISLGTIAAGIAHEIRNPLASIRTFAQLLPTNSDDPEFKNSFGKMVIQDADRITRVIQSMLSFARPGTVNVADHGASEIVDEALTLIQSRLKGKNIAVTKLSHERPILRVDKQQIIQVLLNLLNNAIDALPTEGQICITTGVHHVEGTKGQSGQRFGVIEIADNGPGIPVAVRSRLFDPFFTTKKDGTGLGLSISQKIVRDHNGLVTVSSIEGRGTSFQVHLPLA